MTKPEGLYRMIKYFVEELKSTDFDVSSILDIDQMLSLQSQFGSFQQKDSQPTASNEVVNRILGSGNGRCKCWNRYNKQHFKEAFKNEKLFDKQVDNNSESKEKLSKERADVSASCSKPKVKDIIVVRIETEENTSDLKEEENLSAEIVKAQNRVLVRFKCYKLFHL